MLARKVPYRQLKIFGTFTQYAKTVQIPEIVTVEHLKAGIHLVIENDQTGTVQEQPSRIQHDRRDGMHLGDQRIRRFKRSIGMGSGLTGTGTKPDDTKEKN